MNLSSGAQTQADMIAKTVGAGIMQVIIEVDDVAAARAVACEVAFQLGKPHAIPLYCLSGVDFESHNALFSRFERETTGEIVPRNTRLILYVEGFDKVPATHQRSYSHLVDGDGQNSALALGSVLLLNVGTDARGKIEGGCADRGVWVTVPSV